MGTENRCNEGWIESWDLGKRSRVREWGKHQKGYLDTARRVLFNQNNNPIQWSQQLFNVHYCVWFQWRRHACLPMSEKALLCEALLKPAPLFPYWCNHSLYCVRKIFITEQKIAARLLVLNGIIILPNYTLKGSLPQCTMPGHGCTPTECGAIKMK